MSSTKQTIAQLTTIVERGTTLRGAITSACPVEVRGQVDGELTAPSLVIRAGGSVSGKVTVEELRSSGDLAGEIQADTLYLAGTVKDRTVLRAKKIEVALRASGGSDLLVSFGDCTLEVGDLAARAEVDARSEGSAQGRTVPPAGGGEASAESVV